MTLRVCGRLLVCVLVVPWLATKFISQLQFIYQVKLRLLL